jgi:large subunit ribosomal protein L23
MARLNISIHDIILASHVSDKAIKQNEANKLTLKVRMDATKEQIKEAVETFFNITISKINVVVVKGKNKTFGRRYKFTSQSYKKAIVTLPKDKKLSDLIMMSPEQEVIDNIKNEKQG